MTRFQVIALSSLDPDGTDRRDEPRLLYPDALKAAEQLKSQGKAFRVFAENGHTVQQIKSFLELGALI